MHRWERRFFRGWKVDRVELEMGYLVFVVGEWKSIHEGVEMIGVKIY